MKPYAKVDASNLPLVLVKFTGEKSTDENFDQYLADLAEIYDDRESLSIVFDASKAVMPKLSHQKKQALWISQHWKMIQTYCKATAYVIPNLAVRSVLKMIFSFQHQPVPYKVFSNYEEAKAWICNSGMEVTTKKQ